MDLLETINCLAVLLALLRLFLWYGALRTHSDITAEDIKCMTSSQPPLCKSIDSLEICMVDRPPLNFNHVPSLLACLNALLYHSIRMKLVGWWIWTAAEYQIRAPCGHL